MAQKGLDTWSCKQVGTSEVSMLLVTGPLMKMSSRDCHGHRWFVEPIENKENWRIQWQKRTESETWIACADRVRNLEGEGAVKGLRSLKSNVLLQIARPRVGNGAGKFRELVSALYSAN